MRENGQKFAIRRKISAGSPMPTTQILLGPALINQVPETNVPVPTKRETQSFVRRYRDRTRRLWKRRYRSGRKTQDQTSGCCL